MAKRTASEERSSRKEERPSRKTKIADEVYQELQAQILSDVYAAGDRLPPERELAGQLGTNRNTLREAIRRLEQSRLVTVRQGQGVTVSDFRRTGNIDVLEGFLAWGSDLGERARALADLMSARTWVLEYTLTVAVQRADTGDTSKIRDITLLLLRAHDTRDRESLVLGYHRWLEAIVDAAHSLPIRWIANPFLELNRTFMERFPFLWVHDASFPDYLRETERAIATGDADAACAANRRYYERIDGIVVSMLRDLFAAGAITEPPDEDDRH